MLYTEWNMDDALAVVREETREEERENFIKMLDQGLSVEDIKQRLTETE
ncbi:MAG: hypothetical protein FWD13_13590 [Treponema sp.]|nr:hypothetical protein [Treponema sp.]